MKPHERDKFVRNMTLLFQERYTEQPLATLVDMHVKLVRYIEKHKLPHLIQDWPIEHSTYFKLMNV